ncbi:CcdB family protein [Paraburkholderia kirstenboschensis]|uniref:CcdB family protein n=2 Tax=Paraburkholderia kirstenboschensis TaxID=1245436 RepID=UPI000FFBF09F
MVPMPATNHTHLSRKPTDLLPVFAVDGEECFLDTPGMSAVPLNVFGKCIGSLSDRREAILPALDRIFGHTER